MAGGAVQGGLPCGPDRNWALERCGRSGTACSSWPRLGRVESQAGTSPFAFTCASERHGRPSRPRSDGRMSVAEVLTISSWQIRRCRRLGRLGRLAAGAAIRPQPGSRRSIGSGRQRQQPDGQTNLAGCLFVDNGNLLEPFAENISNAAEDTRFPAGRNDGPRVFPRHRDRLPEDPGQGGLDRGQNSSDSKGFSGSGRV